MPRHLLVEFNYHEGSVVLTQAPANGTSETELHMRLTLDECGEIEQFARRIQDSLEPVGSAMDHLEKVMIKSHVDHQGKLKADDRLHPCRDR